jgi:hypothetical protein
MKLLFIEYCHCRHKQEDHEVRSSQEKTHELNQELVFDVIRKTYEKGKSNEEMTIQKIMEDLIIDLKTCTE